MNLTTKKLTYTAVFTALIFLTTAFLSIPTGIGYVNLGDAFIFIAALYFNPLIAFAAAGICIALSDIALGYSFYALPTFIIQGLEGVAVALISKTLLKKDVNILFSVMLSAITGAVIMVGGYFITNTFLYSFEGAIAAIVNDSLQGIANVVLGVLLSFLLIKTDIFKDVSDNVLRRAYEKRTRD